MKILIIGGGGNIGQAIISNIDLKKYKVFSINKKKVFKSKKIKYFKLDYYKNYSKVKKLVEKFKFDIVINLICFNKSQVLRDYRLYKKKISKYLFISSTSIYKRNKNLINEDSELDNTKNKYIKGKLEAEKFLINNTDAFPYIILRVCQLYGNNNIPSLFKKRTFTILKDMYLNKRIFLPKGYTNIWKVISVKDLAKIIIQIINCNDNKIICNYFNIVTDKSITWKKIYQIYSLNSFVKVKKEYFSLNKIKNLDKNIYDHLNFDKLKNANFSNKKIFKIVKKPKFSNFEKDIKFIIKKNKKKILATSYDQKLLKVLRNSLIRN